MEPTGLIDGWKVGHGWAYLGIVFVYGLGVRVASSVLRAFESCLGGRGAFLDAFWCAFNGIGKSEEAKSEGDYGHSFWLGLIELATYPVLMATKQWPYIGAWIALKTIAPWGAWSNNRATFNRFLIGNALVLILAYSIVQTGFISKVDPGGRDSASDASREHVATLAPRDEAILVVGPGPLREFPRDKE